MKKKLLLLTFFVSIICFCQEVKVKKGEIQVNGKSVAKIKKKDKLYLISNLISVPLFTAVITDRTPMNNIGSKRWLQLTGNNGNVREILMEKSGGFTLSNEKFLTENLILNVGSLFPDTIDEARVEEFFKTEDRSISKAEDMILEREKKMIHTEDSIAKVNNLMLGQMGVISAKSKEIGYLVRKTFPGSMPNIEKRSYIVMDLNRIPIAQLDFSVSASQIIANQKQVEGSLLIKTYDNKGADLKAKNISEKITDDEVAIRLIRRVYANGYTLGDMKNRVEQEANDSAWAAAEQTATEIKDAKNSSLNLYGVPGYVIDKGGNRKEGNITIEFESIDEKRGKDKGMADTTIYGGFIALENNEKKESFRAKDGVKFYTGDRGFIGTKGSEDASLNSSSGSQLGVFGESQFFEIEYEKDSNYVLSHVKSLGHYYLKLSNQDKAVYLGSKAIFGEKKPEKIKKIFDGYLKCSKLDFDKYETTTKEGLIKVVDDYQVICLNPK